MKNEGDRQLSRRDFLTIGGLALAGSFLFPQEVQAKESPHLDFPHVRDFALRIDRMYDRLPDYHVEMTQERLDEWVGEIVPFYEANGFINKALYPASEQVSNMKDAANGGSLNILGLTTCQLTDTHSNQVIQDVKINQRMNTPISRLYQYKRGVEVLVHELAHVQQGALCTDGFFIGSELETSAQVATPEILASMGLEGNKTALYSLVDFLEEVSMDAAKYLALSDKKLMPQYQRLVDTVYAKPLEQAHVAYINNIVKGYEKEHLRYLEIYNYDPLDKLLTAHQYTHDVVDGLQFSNTKVTMDDFGYFISGNHAERIMAQVES